MADVDNEKLLMVVRKLEALTADNRVRWSPTDQEDTYLFAAKSSSVLVGSVNGDAEHPFFVQILSPDGAVTEGLETEKPDIADWAAPTWAKAVMDLHRRARRSATNADAVLDALLQDLKDLDPPF